MTWDRGSSSEAHLRRLVLGAAFLHREFLALKAEESFKNDSNGRIHYVFDNDVMEAFAIPWRWGPESGSDHGKNSFGYGQLLPKRSIQNQSVPEKVIKKLRIEEDIRATNVIKLLCEHVFLLASDGFHSGKIFQFPGHYQETSKSIGRVEENSAAVGYQKPGSATEILIRNSLLILRARLNSNPAISEIVGTIQNVAEVAFVRELSGPSRGSIARDNYHKLENSGERCVIDTIVDLGHRAPSEQHLVDLHSRALELVKLFWANEFSERSHASSDAIDADAESFAKLSIINKQLIDQNISERVVFVTGSKDIIKRSYKCGERMKRFLRDRAAEQVASGASSEIVAKERAEWSEYFGFSPEIQSSKASFRWFERFSLHYVRHISAFSKGTLVENADTRKLDDLFHGLFALRWRKNSFKRTDIEQIVEFPWKLKLSFLDTDPDSLYVDVLKQWDQLSMRALEAKRSADWNFPKNAEAHLARSFSGGNSVSADQMVVDIVEQVDRQRDRSMLKLSDMGARALLERGLLSVRNPPDLYFAKFSKTNAIFENLSLPNYYIEHPDYFLRDYENITEECADIDQSEDGDDRQLSYLKFMVLGAVFASAEKWSTALGHAERAIRTVTRYRVRKPNLCVTDGSEDVAQLSGREAYYLAATCSRMLSRKQEDLKGARTFLKEALTTYSSDIDVWPGLANKLGKCRYLSENLAIELSEYYFSRWENDINDTGVKLTCKDFSVNSIYDHCKDLVFELQESEDIFSGPMTLLTRISTATNILQTSVIRAFRHTDGCDDFGVTEFLSEDLVRKCVQLLSSIEIKEESVETSLVRSYRNAGALLVGAYDLCDFNSEDELISFFDEAASGGLMHYDEWRYKALKDFLHSRWINGAQASFLT